MRFGLVGTGRWARETHGAGLLAEPWASLVAVWGRDPVKAGTLAAQLGIDAAGSYEDLLDQVDAVSFAVPPGVQARLALQAAAAGKHLLLEKPIAASLADAERLEAEVDRAGVASVVFFTHRFDRARRAWLAGLEGERWDGAWGRFLVPAGVNVDPSTWRMEKGALWDLCPHLLAMLVPALSPVVAVRAEAGNRDLVHLFLRHSSGATSTLSATLHAPPAVWSFEVAVWGEAGISIAPDRSGTSADNLRRAAGELIEQAGRDRPAHPCDVHFGLEVVKILADAEQLLGLGE